MSIFLSSFIVSVFAFSIISSIVAQARCTHGIMLDKSLTLFTGVLMVNTWRAKLVCGAAYLVLSSQMFSILSIFSSKSKTPYKVELFLCIEITSTPKAACASSSHFTECITFQQLLVEYRQVLYKAWSHS